MHVFPWPPLLADLEMAKKELESAIKRHSLSSLQFIMRSLLCKHMGESVSMRREARDRAAPEVLASSIAGEALEARQVQCQRLVKAATPHAVHWPKQLVVLFSITHLYTLCPQPW